MPKKILIVDMILDADTYIIKPCANAEVVYKVKELLED